MFHAQTHDRYPRQAAGAPALRLAAVAATVLGAASMLIFGGWACLAPASFANFIGFPPFNQHLIHDAGAFQIGIGVALVVGLGGRDGVFGPHVASFAVDTSMHVSNAKAKSELGWQPRFKTYREGIAVMVAATPAESAVLRAMTATHRR
jgi:hypothetical protein